MKDVLFRVKKKVYDKLNIIKSDVSDIMYYVIIKYNKIWIYV